MLKQLWIDLRVRFRALFRRRTLNARAREEMEFHLTMREQQLVDRGVSAEEARSQTRREFGNRLLLEEAAIDSWRYAAMQRFVQEIASDLRYASRCLARTPGFTVAAMVTIGLGIGVNAGIFTVLNGVLFRDLPVPNAHELVAISQRVEGVQDLGQDSFSTSEYLTYRDRAQTLSGVLAFAGARGETILGGDAPQTIYGALVSCNYFEVLRQPPALGRGLAAQDCERGAEPLVVLGHDLWRTAFAADAGIVGRTVELNRRLFTVVGVAAEGTYSGPIRIGYFAPISADALLGPDDRYKNDRFSWLSLIGRRRDGTSLEQVRAELDVIAAQIDQQQPGRSTALMVERAKWMTVPRGQRSAATGAAAVLMTAFAFILLIACANVANLLLARGAVRSREIGIRLSLGASRARVVRQLLTESILISFAGGLLGSVLALWSFQALVAFALPGLIPPELSFSFAWDLSPDFRVLLFAVALILGTGILFGLAPALHLSKLDLLGVIRQDTAGDGSRGGGRLRGMLVGVQVALAMALMISAGLLLRGLYAAYATDPGIDYRGIAYVSLEGRLEGADYGPEKAAVLRERLMNNIAAMPGVEGVAYAMRAPLAGDAAPSAIRLPGESKNASRQAELNAVTPGYFSVLGLPIVRGRTFTETEIRNAQGAATRPVIVSETAARNLWPGDDPIGRTLLRENIIFQGGTVVSRDISLQVVGVAADAQVTSLGRIDPYYIYEPGGASVLLVKSRIGLSVTASSIDAVVRALDPALVIPVLPLEANVRWWRGVSGTVTALGAGLGALALVLASVGIYGVVSYAVRRRYREIGIRMALGAGAANVLGMILRQTMGPVIVGAVIGVVAASAATGILSSVLFGVSPADPIGLGGAALLVLGVALVAGVMAARPATLAGPNAALRSE